MWWAVHAAPAAVGQAAHELPGLQKAGTQNHFRLQYAHQAQAAVGFGRQESRVYGAQKGQQGRVRTAVNPF